MFFQFVASGECLRLGVEKALVLVFETHRIHPRLYRLGILHGLDARLELLKVHLSQSLLVMADQSTLILVVIWRAEPYSCEAAPVHKREIAFRRIDGCLLLLEYHRGMLAQRESHRFVLSQKDALARR